MTKGCLAACKFAFSLRFPQLFSITVYVRHGLALLLQPPAKRMDHDLARATAESSQLLYRRVY